VSEPGEAQEPGLEFLGRANTDPDLPVIVGRGLGDAKPVSHSQVTMTQLMSPQDTNLFGNVFGGVILAAVDRIAYVCAARHSGGPCVTASFDQVDFRSPIQIGEIVTLEASINAVGKTSAEVGVRVSAENVQGDGRRHTNSCYVTMVAIDDAGHPIPMPRLVIETEDELRRYQDAEERKKARLLLARSRAARQG
jgi:acyl-CoA hydrolase